MIFYFNLFCVPYSQIVTLLENVMTPFFRLFTTRKKHIGIFDSNSSHIFKSYSKLEFPYKDGPRAVVFLELPLYIGNSILFYLSFDTHDSSWTIFILKWEIFIHHLLVCSCRKILLLEFIWI